MLNSARFRIGLFVVAMACGAVGRPAPASADDEPLAVPATDKTLAYKLYAPPATAPAAGGLVVWLHPAGAAMDDRVVAEYRAPLAKAGMFLLVPATADPAAWAGPDAGKAPATIDDALTRDKRLDKDRVVLLGCSAGGQVAFALAQAAPARYAGIATMSAFPMAFRDGKQTSQLWMPPAEQKERLRFFLLAGEQEPGRAALRRVEAIWRANGFWVTLKEMPGAGHAYAAGQQDTLVPWMVQAASGEKPDDPMAEARTKDVAERKAVAERFVNKLKELGKAAGNAPATQPEGEAAKTAAQIGAFRVWPGAGWQRAQGGPANATVWRLAGGDGEAQPVQAEITGARVTLDRQFNQWLGAHVLGQAAQGWRTAVHGSGRTAIAGGPALLVVLSDRRVAADPKTKKLGEEAVYRIEVFLPETQREMLALAVQWRESIGPERAAELVLDLCRHIQRTQPPATQPGEPAAPDIRNILPQELLD